MSEVADFFFAQHGMFVIPIEHLSPTGVDAELAQLVGARAGLPDDWLRLFNEAFACYWSRASDLSTRAPQHWFPPRLQQVAVVTDAAGVRPFFQPFHKSSWLLYASDFDGRFANLEFATYQLLHVERMGLLQQVVPALTANLSYWLVRTDAEIEAFVHACARARRPDATGFRALAAALPWIRGLHHEVLKPLVLAPSEPVLTVPRTGLILPRSCQGKLEGLVQQWTAAAERVAAGHYAGYAATTKDHAPELARWLATTRPELLVTGEGGKILWQPSQAMQTDAVAADLRGITDAAAASVRADLELIEDRSRRFRRSLRAPERLPQPHASTEQNGLCYMHVEHKLIAYNLREGRMQRLREPAPAYERFMLAARTIHEWSHLAVDAGWVPVEPARRGDHERRCAELNGLFDEIVARAPGGVRAHTQAELARIAAGTSAGAALAQVTLGRMPDFQANLLARRYLTHAERQTYLRNNVATLAFDYPVTQLFQRLARYAYEYQYLRLAAIADPLAYFLGSTWFAEQYLRAAILTSEQMTRLFDLVGELCADHAIDGDQFDFGAI